MKIKILGKNNTIFNHFISEIRDVNIQLDSMRFRRNIERIGEVFAYEISKEINYTNVNITTPLGVSNESLMIVFFHQIDPEPKKHLNMYDYWFVGPQNTKKPFV